MKVIAKLVNALVVSILFGTFVHAYKMTVINRGDEPIYFKISNALIASFLAKTPCDKGVVFGPIAPRSELTKNWGGLCVGVCFTGIRILNAKREEVASESWFCQYDTKMYVKKDRYFNSWELSYSDPGLTGPGPIDIDFAQFEVYVPKAGGSASKGSNEKPLIMPQELSQALQLKNERIENEYWMKHPEMNRKDALVSEEVNILSNLAFVKKYLQDKPQYAESRVDIHGNEREERPLDLLIDQINALRRKREDKDTDSKAQRLKELTIDTVLIPHLHDMIAVLLKNYKVNPNPISDTYANVNDSPLGKALRQGPYADITVMQMLLHSGADINQAGGKYLMELTEEVADIADYQPNITAYKFLVRWVRDKKISLKDTLEEGRQEFRAMVPEAAEEFDQAEFEFNFEKRFKGLANVGNMPDRIAVIHDYTVNSRRYLIMVKKRPLAFLGLSLDEIESVTPSTLEMPTDQQNNLVEAWNPDKWADASPETKEVVKKIYNLVMYGLKMLLVQLSPKK